MRAPLSWLKEFVDIAIPLDDLVHRAQFPCQCCSGCGSAGPAVLLFQFFNFSTTHSGKMFQEKLGGGSSTLFFKQALQLFHLWHVHKTALTGY